MNFAHPLALLLLLLLVPVALLYWLRVRVPRQTVGTGLFWQKALAEEKARWRWRRWRTKVSLAVQMIIVVLLALAAAGPQIPASEADGADHRQLGHHAGDRRAADAHRCGQRGCPAADRKPAVVR